MSKTDVIIQARMGSTRFPGKVLKKIYNKTILEHVISRVQTAENINDIIIATTIKKEDDRIVDICQNNNIKFYRGSEEDVLSRYYHTAKENKSDIIVRITSDCPLIDKEVMENMIEFYIKNNYDFVTNAGPDASYRTFPRGLDVEIFSYDTLEKAHLKSRVPSEREHVTLYFYDHPDEYNIYVYKNKTDYSGYRWTLDTAEDWKLIKKIYNELYNKDQDFSWRKVLTLLEDHPGLSEINMAIEQKKYH